MSTRRGRRRHVFPKENPSSMSTLSTPTSQTDSTASSSKGFGTKVRVTSVIMDESLKVSSGTFLDPVRAVETDTAHEVKIHALPEEVIVKMLSYLEHGDLLQSRLVMKSWNRIVSAWSGFNGKVVFVVKSGTQSRSMLRQSQTNWRRIRLEKFKLTEKNHEFQLPPHLSDKANCISFFKSVVTWDGIRQILKQFKCLNEIEIVHCKRRRKEANQSSGRLTRAVLGLNESLMDVMCNVRILRLELRRISDMLFYLNQLNQFGIRLTELSLRDIYDGLESTAVEIAQDLLREILQTLRQSFSSISIIKINFVTLSLVNNFFPEVIQPLISCSSKITQLKTFEVRHFAQEPNNQRDLDIFFDFIKNQKNLTEIRLPLPGDANTEQCRSIVTSLNPKIKSIHVTSEKYLTPKCLDSFINLKTVKLDFEIRQFILSPTIHKSVEELQLEKGSMLLSVPLIAEKFPNLTSLNLNGQCEDVPPIDDRCLQTICQNLRKIRKLVIGACSSISDYGVTGIKKEYCEKLFKSRSICLDTMMEIPRENIIGSPLHTLRGLTSITFTGPTSISDVGIYYGFRFFELHYLNMRNNIDISDWGLEWLGKLNPNLDFIYLGLGPWVTQIGVARLRCRLKRIKRRNSVYIWPNQEYYSSDESYALESDDEFYVNAHE